MAPRCDGRRGLRWQVLAWALAGTALVWSTRAVAAPAPSPPGSPADRPAKTQALDPLTAAYLRLGAALYAQGQKEEAIELLGAAAELAPESALARAALGDAYAGLETEAGFILAAVQYREALRLDPALDDARLGLARSSYRSGRVDQGIQNLEALLVKGGRIRPEYAGELASYYLLDGRASEGIAALEKALARDPAANPVRVVLAVLYRHAGDEARAAAALRETIGREPAGSPLRSYAEGLLARRAR